MAGRRSSQSYNLRAIPDAFWSCDACGSESATLRSLPCQHVCCEACITAHNSSNTHPQSALLTNCPMCARVTASTSGRTQSLGVVLPGPRRMSMGDALTTTVRRQSSGETFLMTSARTARRQSTGEALTAARRQSSGEAYAAARRQSTSEALTATRRQSTGEVLSTGRRMSTGEVMKFLRNQTSRLTVKQKGKSSSKESLDQSKSDVSDLTDDNITLSFRSTRMDYHPLPWDASAVCFMPDGRLLVCRWGGSDLLAFQPITKRDGSMQLKPLTFTSDWKIPKTLRAWGVACTSKQLLVTDYESGKILRFNLNGKQVSDININFRGDAGLCFIENTLYVTSSSDNIVYAANIKDSTTIVKRFLTKTDTIDMSRPHYVAATLDRLAVSCWGSSMVHVFDHEGEPLYSYGSGEQGYAPGQLDYPQGVAFDGQNNLYIADCYNDRVVVVSSEGALKGCIDLHWDRVCEPAAITIDQEGYLIVTCLKPRSSIAVYKFEAPAVDQ